MIKKIKNSLLIFILLMFKYHLKIIYFFIKLFTKQKNKVFLLSRQSNNVSINYQLLINSLKIYNINYKVICKKVPSSINTIIRNENKNVNILKQILEIIKYYFNLYKQMFYVASSKVVVIDGYNLVTSLLKHKKNTTIIQLWHALGAIKKFGYQTINYKNGLNLKVAKILCMHKNYDYVISGSNEMNKFFAEAFNVNENSVIDCGTPLIDYLLNNNDSVVKQIYKKYPILKNKINILYSPTFRNDGSNNYEEVVKKFDTKKYNLILTFHPKNTIYVNNENIISVKSTEFSTFDILRVVDYVITDYSALVLDSCVLDKKVLLYVYDYDLYSKENGLNIDLFKELEGNVSKSIEDLLKIIENNRYNYTSYKKFKKKYLNNLNGDSTKKIIKIIKEAL